MTPEFATDLLEMVNALKGLVKSKSVKYNATNFDYIPLDDLLEVIKKHDKFALIQPLSSLENGTPCVENILIHESGEVLTSGKFPILLSTTKMQDVGSAITYSRRYSLGAFLGISTETDNDANFESDVKEAKATPKQIEVLARIYTGENLTKLLQANKIATLNDITAKKASELISKVSK
jgi:hypothetical protein